MLPTFFGLTLLALGLPFTALAEPHAQPHVNRHRDIAKRALGNVDLHKRFSDSRWTFYDVGLGACGKHNTPDDFIVALNTPQFGGGYPGPNCFKTITMTFNGKTTQATIMDECPGCPFGGLDLSRGLFNFFSSPDAGVIYGTWNFNGGSGDGSGDHAPPPPPPPPPKPQTTTHSTTHTPQPSTTSTSTKIEAKTTKESSTTKSSSSTTSSSASTTSTTDFNKGAASGLAVPTGTIESSPGHPENINAVNQAIIGISAVIAAGANNV